jgi:hypothetical protein
MGTFKLFHHGVVTIVLEEATMRQEPKHSPKRSGLYLNSVMEKVPKYMILNNSILFFHSKQIQSKKY